MKYHIDEVKVVSDVVNACEWQKQWHQFTTFEYLEPLDAFKLLNSRSSKYIKMSPDHTTAKLITALESFKEDGACAKDVHERAFPDVKYCSDNHPFKDLGLFVDVVPGQNKMQTPKYAIVHAGTINGSTTNTILIDAISRAKKNKYKLNCIGQEIFSIVNKNKPFYDLKSKINGMMTDEDGPIHWILTENLKTGDMIDVEWFQNEIMKQLNDTYLHSVFGSTLKDWSKKMKNIIV